MTSTVQHNSPFNLRINKSTVLLMLLAATFLLFGCRRSTSPAEIIDVIEEAADQNPTLDGGGNQDPRITIDPVSGGANTLINVNGMGWNAGETVNLILADQTGRSDVLSTVNAEAGGTFAVSFNYPSLARWQAPGNYFVLAFTPDLAIEVTAPFALEATAGNSTGDTIAQATDTPQPISRGGGGGTQPTATPVPPTAVPPTAVPATQVAVSGPRITIEPASGTVNTEVLVTCIGFSPNTRVNVHLAGLVQTRGGAPSRTPYSYASTTTNAQGSCRMLFPMPQNWPDGRPLESGDLNILVASEDFGQRGTAAFRYTAPAPTATPTSTHTATAAATATSTPTNTATNTPVPTATPTVRPFLRVSPETGGAGTVVSLECGGFTPNTIINIHLAGLVQTRGGATQSPTTYATRVTDANGNCPLSFTMPSTWPNGQAIETGELTVLAASTNFATRASDTFSYVAVAPPTHTPTNTPTNTPVPNLAPFAEAVPAVGGAGTLVSVGGGGFPAGARVNIHLGKFDGQIGRGVIVTYGAGIADANGNFSARFTMPVTWPDGSVIETGKILIVAATQGMDIQASAFFDYVQTSATAVPPTATTQATAVPQPTATPQATAAPTNTPVPAAGGWNVSYWNNPNLSGAPVLNRVDSAINFNWEEGSPASSVPVDNFSARWARTVNVTAGNYEFVLTVDDGARVYVDNQVVIDEWNLGSQRTVRVQAYLNGGSHDLRVEYFERSERALIRFDFVAANQGWRGEYFSNPTLSGSPSLVRTDPEINFLWETGSPESRIPVDQFSARWTRRVNFAAGVYRFNAFSDDGVRIWIDQTLIMDEWRDSRSNTYSVDVNLPAGPHDIRVEYYENTLGARIRVWWEDQVTSAQVPTATPDVPTATWTPAPPTATSVPATSTPTASVGSGTIKVFTVAISTGRDDAEQRGDGQVKHDSDELEMTLHDSGQQIIGLRFQNLPIPQGSIIVGAHIDFTAEAISTSATNLIFQGEAVDNSVRFERDRFNISYRNQTNARVAWNNVPGWSNVGQISRSPNLAALVQEIVNRGSWQPGNAMSFIVSGEGFRIAESFDGNSGAAPRLTVEFR